MDPANRKEPDKHLISYDLHIHSDLSDGTFSPEEIIQLSKVKGLKGISITDHDDINPANIGPYAEENSLKYIYGIEFSTNRVNLHILGYNLDINTPELRSYLDFQKIERENAVRKMCEKTKKFGIPIDYDELLIKRTHSLGRPHIAQIMMEKGYVRDFYEAFNKWLKNDRPIFVDYEKSDYIEIIEIILKSKGAAVLAHPGLLNQQAFEAILEKSVKSGLQGLEVYYPRHSIKQTGYLKEIAEKNNLILTGGSDFHGSIKPDIKIGDAGISNEEFEKFIQILKIRA